MNTTVTLEQKNGQVVDTNHLNNLVGNYKQQRWLDNTQKLGKPDALSTWYGMDELQAFLDLAKQHHADGIKMFYGVYDEQHPNKQIAGRQTVVLVATRKNLDKPGNFNKAIMTTINGKKEILAFNYGEMCPPYCGGTPPDGDPYIEFEMDNIGQIIVEKDGKIDIL